MGSQRAARAAAVGRLQERDVQLLLFRPANRTTPIDRVSGPRGPCPAQSNPATSDPCRTVLESHNERRVSGLVSTAVHGMRICAIRDSILDPYPARDEA